MLKSVELRQVILTLLTSAAVWGGSTLITGVTDRAATQAKLEQHDRELSRQRDSIDRIALVLERQQALSETYGQALKDIAAELREDRHGK